MKLTRFDEQTGIATLVGENRLLVGTFPKPQDIPLRHSRSLLDNLQIGSDISQATLSEMTKIILDIPLYPTPVVNAWNRYISVLNRWAKSFTRNGEDDYRTQMLASFKSEAWGSFERVKKSFGVKRYPDGTAPLPFH